MLSSAGFCTRLPLDKNASEAPMSAWPDDASAIPVPDPVAAVVKETLENCRWYAAAQAPNSGYRSVLPVSVSETAAGAGLAGMVPGPPLWLDPVPAGALGG